MAWQNHREFKSWCSLILILSSTLSLLCPQRDRTLLVAEVLADEPTHSPLHRVTFADGKSVTRTIDARILLTAQDGGLLIEGQDGKLWTVNPKQLEKDDATDEAFQPLSADQVGKQLQQELDDFGIKSPSDVILTKHYVICSTAGRKYGEWVGTLFERLYDGFQAYWKAAGVELCEPEFPLPAFVLKDQTEFVQLATKHDGPDAAVSKGYYSIETNRIVMFDLSANANQAPAKSFDEIRRKMAASPFNVATVVHEATHQIAFNSGMHTRFADNPVWLTEGMAMFFEVPDLESQSGWKTVGKVNRTRLNRFRDSLKQRREGSPLAALIQTDDRLKNVEQAETAYAESWALTYFLIKTRKNDYVTYLKTLQSKPRLKADTPEDRLRDFRKAFGDDLEMLDRDFKRWLSRLSK